MVSGGSGDQDEHEKCTGARSFCLCLPSIVRSLSGRVRYSFHDEVPHVDDTPGAVVGSGPVSVGIPNSEKGGRRGS